MLAKPPQVFRQTGPEIVATANGRHITLVRSKRASARAVAIAVGKLEFKLFECLA